jgi:hypothetical protein
VAGEKKGIAYEALVKLVLDELVSTGKLAGTVFWNEKPAGMTIEPDFTVGPDKDRPSHMFLVTHSGASGNSHMKFWRNIGELVEAKVFLPTVPQVIAVAFDAVIKTDLKNLQNVAFDGELVVGDTLYGPALLKWIDSIYTRLPQKTEDKPRALSEAASKNATTVAAIRSLVSELANQLKKGDSQRHPLWTIARRRSIPSGRKAKNTSFKKGIAKLLVVSDPDAALAAAATGHAIADDPLLDDLGWVSRSIAGSRIIDPDILFVSSIRPSGPIIKLAKSLAKKKSLTDMLRPLRDAEAFVAVARLLATNWDEVLNSVWLHRELTSSHGDPLAYAAAAGCTTAKYVRPGVVAEALVELLKAGAGRRQGFGLARLVALLDDQATHRPELEKLAKSIGLGPISWRGANTVSYGYRDWLFGADRKNFSLTTFELLRVAAALSTAAKQLSKSDAIAALQDLRQLWVSNLFEAKFASHRDLDVLDQIVIGALGGSGHATERIAFFPSVWAELADTAGASVNVRSGSTAVIKVSESIIVTKSAHDSHTNDKRKELCGRAFAMRYRWDNNKKAFGHRLGVSRLFLVLDGSWTDGDLAALLRAGWDTIFYPDEMDKLVKAIV